MFEKIRAFWGIVFLTVGIAIFLWVSVIAAESDLPLPEGTEIVMFFRPSAASNPDLESKVGEIKVLNYYLSLVDIGLEQVDQAIIFMPYDRNWIDNVTRGKLQNIPSNGGIIIRGKFDSAAKLKSLKSSLWQEKQYANKKILWWSTGEKYLLNSKTSESVALLRGKDLLISGSEDAMKNVLDVAGDKKKGLAADGVYQRLAGQFQGNNQTAIGIFTVATETMRQQLRDEIDTSHYPILNTLLGYSDRLKQIGFSMRNAGSDVLLDSFLGMDSDNTAMVLSGVLQVGGGLANYIPANNPNRAILANLQVNREGNVVIGQSRLTGPEFKAILQQR